MLDWKKIQDQTETRKALLKATSDPVPPEQARTFFLIKPDAFARSKVGTILAMIEREGFFLDDLAQRNPPKALLREHYREHASWPGLEEMLSWMVSGPVLAGIARLTKASRNDPVRVLRDLVGPFAPPRNPRSIRGQLMRDDDPPYRNLIHAADSADSAEREITLWFPGRSYRCEAGPEEARR